MLLAAAAAIALLSCTTDPQVAIEDCQDPACLRREAVALWAQDPGAVQALVAEHADPMVRAHLVEAVIEADPSASPELCVLLYDGITRQRCERLAADPVLWQLDPARPAQAALALGEVALVVAPGPTFRTPPLTVDEAMPCPPSVPTSSCRTWRGIEAAMIGDLTAAAGACAGVAAPRWRDACLLEAAEAGCRRDQPEACGQAAELCAAAGVHRSPCLARIATALAATAPSSEVADANAWFALTSRVRELRHRLRPLDPILADRAAHRVWAEALLLSYGLARKVSGAPLDHLPPEATPHVRAAIAWRQAARGDGGNLAQRAALVTAAMGERELRTEATAMPAGRLRVAGHWPDDLPGEETIAWVAYLQDARRAVAQDPEVDARLCVLEAAARMVPVQADMLVEGLGDPDEVVRWTAARLMARVAPEHPALAHARDDPSALVRARAGH